MKNQCQNELATVGEVLWTLVRTSLPKAREIVLLIIQSLATDTDEVLANQLIQDMTGEDLRQ